MQQTILARRTRTHSSPMTVRTAQRIVAASFIVGTTSALVLFIYVLHFDRETPLPFDRRQGWKILCWTVLGALSWLLMLAGCATVLLHPKPETTLLGQYALGKEPFLRDAPVGAKRQAGIFVVVAVALLGATVAALVCTDTWPTVAERLGFG